MDSKRLDTLPQNAVAFDTETWLIQPGLLAPPMVCGSIARWVDGKIVGELLDKDQCLQAFEALLDNPDIVITGANIAYDMLVMAVFAARRGKDLITKIFDAYEAGRVYDTLIAQSLDAMADGCLGKDPITGGDLRDPVTRETTNRYSQNIVHHQLTGKADAKANDMFRLRYFELDDVPIAEWPEAARTYPVDDVVVCLEDTLIQAGHLPKAGAKHMWSADDTCSKCGVTLGFGPVPDCTPLIVRHRNIHSLSDQVYTAWAMHLGAAWGFYVNQASVDVIEKEVVAAREAASVPLLEKGFLKWKKEKGELKRAKSMSMIARRVAVAYGASGTCPACDGTGKVPSEKNPKSKINCVECGATGFDLSTAPTLPKTDTDRIGTGRDVLNESGDDDLMELAEYDANAKTIQTYIPYLRKARTASGQPRPLTLRPNVLLETDRTSYGDSIMMFPRVGGLRACIEARPGYFLSTNDYSFGELITHSENLLDIVGESALANAILSGFEPHKALGATMIGLTYEEFDKRYNDKRHPGYKQVKDARQAAKPGNFGLPGGMSSARLVLQQREQGQSTPCPNGPMVIDKYGTRGYKGLRFCILMDGAESCGATKVTQWGRAGYERPCPPTCVQCLQCADRLKAAWHRQWPEMKPYFAFISRTVENGMVLEDMSQLAPGEVRFFVSNLIRGGVSFTSGSNGFFQARLACASKRAIRRIQRECCDRSVRVPSDRFATPTFEGPVSAYAGAQSPLYGSRAIIVQHDETLAEHPISNAHDGTMRIAEIMERAFMEVCPRMAKVCKAPGALMATWQKAAEPVFDASGRLIPWEPGM